MSELASQAVRYRIAVGPLAGQRTLRLRTAPAQLDPPSAALTALREGFSLNAAVACEAHQRAKLERLCQYMARGLLALERLWVDGDGLVVLKLKRPFRVGTTQVLYTPGFLPCALWAGLRPFAIAPGDSVEPLDFIARLAALVPRPRCHLIRYHGLFTPNARHRRLVVPVA